jgi:hypothetical protein
MRFMVFVKGNERSESGEIPTQQELAEMGKFNEELVKAGVMLDGDGLRPTSYGARVRYGGDAPTVTDGPFTEAKEIVAGYWIWEVKSQEEAIEWLKRAPFREGEVELRPFAQPEDFGEAFTPELREQEERLRAETERRQQP